MPAKIPYNKPPHLERADAAGRRRYERDEDRKEDKRFYKLKAWRELRTAVLRRHHYLCASCLKRGRYVTACDVHHIVERKTDPGRALDASNLEPLCKSCHNGKRADGPSGRS